MISFPQLVFYNIIGNKEIPKTVSEVKCDTCGGDTSEDLMNSTGRNAYYKIEYGSKVCLACKILSSGGYMKVFMPSTKSILYVDDQTMFPNGLRDYCRSILPVDLKEKYNIEDKEVTYEPDNSGSLVEFLKLKLWNSNRMGGVILNRVSNPKNRFTKQYIWLPKLVVFNGAKINTFVVFNNSHYEYIFIDYSLLYDAVLFTEQILSKYDIVSITKLVNKKGRNESSVEIIREVRRKVNGYVREVSTGKSNFMEKMISNIVNDVLYKD